MIISDISLGFELLVGQNKHLKKVTLGTEEVIRGFVYFLSF